MGSDGSVIHATRLPAPLLFVIGGLSMYLGAAAAVWLFGVLDPAAVAWLRQLGAAVVLLAWRRPGRAVWRGTIFWLAALFGLVTAAMNLVFYESIAGCHSARRSRWSSSDRFSWPPGDHAPCATLVRCYSWSAVWH